MLLTTCAVVFSMKLPYDKAVRRLRAIHVGMLSRCSRPTKYTGVAALMRWGNYGGRGITVADDLRNVDDFVEYAKTIEGWDDNSLSVDRINNDGNYTKGNIRFATLHTQVTNKRPPSNMPVVDSVRMAQAGWASWDVAPTSSSSATSGLRYNCVCSDCGKTSRRRFKTLYSICGCSASYASRKNFIVPPKNAKLNVRIGDVYAGWEVISEDLIYSKASDSHRLLCRCVVCGHEAAQLRGSLLAGNPRTRCLICFNRAQTATQHARVVALARLAGLPSDCVTVQPLCNHNQEPIEDYLLSEACSD